MLKQVQGDIVREVRWGRVFIPVSTDPYGMTNSEGLRVGRGFYEEKKSPPPLAGSVSYSSS
jgi:hypothetical protein